MIVEDGTGVAGANSYVTEDEADSYFEDRGITEWTGNTKEESLVRATAVLDARYRGRFTGYKTLGRGQALEWPGTAAVDAEGYEIPSDEIPTEIKQATFELALRELNETGSTLPDLERGGDIRRLAAGSVEIEYGSMATPQTDFQLVDGILSSLLNMSLATGLSGRAARS